MSTFNGFMTLDTTRKTGLFKKHQKYTAERRDPFTRSKYRTKSAEYLTFWSKSRQK